MSSVCHKPAGMAAGVLCSNHTSDRGGRQSPWPQGPQRSAADLLLLLLWKLQLSRSEFSLISGRMRQVNEQTAKAVDSLRSLHLHRDADLLRNSAWLEPPYTAQSIYCVQSFSELFLIK